MRWRRDTPYPRPKSGEKRTRIKFAWLPTDIGDYTVWFEFFFVEEQWYEALEVEWIDGPTKIIHQTSGWKIVRAFAQRKT